MNAYINLYKDNPTADGTDGTVIATDSSATSPLEFTLDATKNEEKTTAIAIRCESGYKTVADSILSFDGTNKAKWSICQTETGIFADTLTITDTVEQKNILFYVKATSSSDEDPSNDTSVTLKLSTKIGASA